jgi:hypothetical protein
MRRLFLGWAPIMLDLIIEDYVFNIALPAPLKKLMKLGAYIAD